MVRRAGKKLFYKNNGRLILKCFTLRQERSESVAGQKAYETPVLREIDPGSEEYMRIVELIKKRIQEENDEILKHFMEER